MISDYKQKPTALDIDLEVLETEKYQHDNLEAKSQMNTGL